TETETLKQVFPSLDIYYCIFHVGQAWERKLRELHNVEDSRAMRGLLKAIRNANTEAELQERWRNFQVSFPNVSKLILYIEKQWMAPDKLARWALYLRENYQHTNTNNLVESWHKTLKRQHLGYERDLRGDDLICLLQGVVDIDFRTSHFKIVNGLQPMPLSEYDKSIKAKAMALSFDDAKVMTSELIEERK
ncbi:hypothetical protein BGX23_005099, partial [Mortierella sp. AD031]